METRVAFEWERQIRSVGRLGALVLGDFLFGRERECLRELLQAWNPRRHARLRKFLRVKRIGRDQRREQPAQLPQLRRRDSRAGGKGIVGHPRVQC